MIKETQPYSEEDLRKTGIDEETIAAYSEINNELDKTPDQILADHALQNLKQAEKESAEGNREYFEKLVPIKIKDLESSLNSLNELMLSDLKGNKSSDAGNRSEVIDAIKQSIEPYFDDNQSLKIISSTLEELYEDPNFGKTHTNQINFSEFDTFTEKDWKKILQKYVKKITENIVSSYKNPEQILDVCSALTTASKEQLEKFKTVD